MPSNDGFQPMCPLDKTSMTIVSTAPSIEQNIDPVDGSFIVDTQPDFKAFPPIDDTIVFIKQVDWNEVRHRIRGGLNNVGLVVAVIGEKTYDLGVWLAKLWYLAWDNSAESP